MSASWYEQFEPCAGGRYVALSDGVTHYEHSGPADGHLPHMERTDLVNPILLDFLRSVDSAAPAAPER